MFSQIFAPASKMGQIRTGTTTFLICPILETWGQKLVKKFFAFWSVEAMKNDFIIKFALKIKEDLSLKKVCGYV